MSDMPDLQFAAFIRHCDYDDSDKDGDLTDRGIRQALGLGKELAVDFQGLTVAATSSDASRCYTTANAITQSSKRGLHPKTSDVLRTSYEKKPNYFEIYKWLATFQGVQALAVVIHFECISELPGLFCTNLLGCEPFWTEELPTHRGTGVLLDIKNKKIRLLPAVAIPE